MSEDEKRAKVEAWFRSRLPGGDASTLKPIRHARSTEQVELPAELREFLAETHLRIEQGDPSTTIPSDDLLQTHRKADGGSESGRPASGPGARPPLLAYGGLVRGEPTRYAFVYFPSEGTAIRWEFTLTQDEIRELGSGASSQLAVERFERLS